MIPYVIERRKGRERVYDIYSRLMKDRIIFIGMPINDQVANVITAQLLFLTLQNNKKPIQMYINSPGGSITAGMAIYDTMKYVPNTIQTYCIGQCASMGAVLLAGGTKGHRFALPHSQIMIHQPWGGMQGTASDISIQAENILKWKKELNRVLSLETGKPIETIEKDTDRDNFMSAEEAKAYGLIDEVIAAAAVKVAPEAEPADGEEEDDDDDDDEG